MKSKNSKYVLALILACGCIFKTSINVLADNNIPYLTVFNNESTSKGTGIFSDENLQYLSEEEQKQLIEIQSLKDKGIKLSDDQIHQLQCIVTTVVRAKLGDEKFKDFNILMEKKNNKTALTDEEHQRLREYKKTLHNCEDCSNNEVFKQFFR